MTIAKNSDSSLRFNDFIKYPSFLMSGGTCPTGQAACRLTDLFTSVLYQPVVESTYRNCIFFASFLNPPRRNPFRRPAKTKT